MTVSVDDINLLTFELHTENIVFVVGSTVNSEDATQLPQNRDTDSKRQCEEEQTLRRQLVFAIDRKTRYDKPGGSEYSSECNQVVTATVFCVLN